MIQEFILKWILGIVCGALGSLGIVFRKKIKAFFTFEVKQKKKEMLKEVEAEIEEVEGEVEQKSADFAKELLDFKQEIMQLIIPMRAAILSSHYEALLAKCKIYIRRGEITFDELELLEKDYKTYADLGGNGHMEIWMTKIRALPVI